jgi:membrane protein DedA with SNARE-associated domain
MSSFVSLLLTYRYLALLPLAFLEGPILAVAVGFLIFQGHLALLPSFGILMFADVARDVLSYVVGNLGNDRIARSRFGNRLGAIHRLWHEHTVKAVILSKWAYGLNFPLLVSAGIARVSFMKFFSIAMVVTGLQYSALITLGYFFGQSHELIGEYLFASQIFVAILVVLLLGGMYIISRKARDVVVSE